MLNPPCELRYTEIEPSPALRSYIDRFCYYHATTGNTLSEIQRCLPLGMIVLVVHLSGQRCIGVQESGELIYPEAYLVGICEEPVHWKMYGGSEIMAIRFTPEAAVQLFQTPLGELANDLVEAREFNHAIVTGLVNRMQGEKDLPRRIDLIEKFLVQEFSKLEGNHNYFSTSMLRLRTRNSTFSNANLVDAFYRSERQIQRMFKEYIGINPKTYQRIMRFRNTWENVTKIRQADWAQMAYAMGYADQAHLIRDFKSLAGVTPRKVFQL